MVRNPHILCNKMINKLVPHKNCTKDNINDGNNKVLRVQSKLVILINSIANGPLVPNDGLTYSSLHGCDDQTNNPLCVPIDRFIK